MGWPKGKSRKPVVTDTESHVKEATARQQKQEADALVDKAFEKIKHSGDPQDKLLYGMQYDANASSYEWESQNPIKVPKDILEANPGMRFRWRAEDTKSNTLRKGDEYNGWQVYKSSKHPNGKKYGGDLVLCAMPEERARSYNKYTQDLSTQQVRDTQDRAMEALDRAGHELPEFESFQPGRKIDGSNAPAAGISVGASKSRDRRTGAIKEQHRGYHPEEIKERVIKATEERKKGRKYYT